MVINYQKELDKLLLGITKSGEIPTLLLHSCCAPCSSYVLEYLSDFFRITVFYYNPNISPADEYNKRAAQQQKFIQSIQPKHEINFEEGQYNCDAYNRLAAGLENEKEGGLRCHKCYELRLDETAKLAHAKGFDYFTTTLSVSPYKNAEKLNEIGEKLSKQYGIKYLYADFKKKNGYKRSIELSKEYNLYRQDYCGCEFSKRQPIG